LTATPAAGYVFAGWRGDLSGSVNPATLTVNENKAVTATFTQIQYTLTIQSLDGSGSTSPAAGSYTCNQGALAQVTATPSSGWIFDRWLIDEDLTSQENPINVRMDSAHKIKAIFILLQYTLALSANGLGTTSPSIGTHTYNSGSQIIVSATPDSGWQFTGWSGDLSGTSNLASITMNGNKTVTAIFTQNTYTLTTSTTGQGSVSKTPNQTTYTYGASVQLTATPAAEWTFTGWSGDLSGTVNPTTLTITGNMSVTATYTLVTSNDFIETCDTFNTAKWSFEYNAPTVANGEWVFNFPVNSNKNIIARTVATNFGYGTYKITFRTSGPRVSGVNYCPFLYLDNRPTSYNELDIPELFGTQGSYQMSISTYRDTITNSDYRYWQSAINFEDGLTHTWEFNYQSARIDFYIDGQLSYTWIDSSTNPVFAKPPMILYLGAYGKGTNTVAWTWYISQIEYQALS
jgi:uncharacterized repeat protein (TIGR02543 family)